jgi:hypothetical protein
LHWPSSYGVLALPLQEYRADPREYPYLFFKTPAAYQACGDSYGTCFEQLLENNHDPTEVINYWVIGHVNFVPAGLGLQDAVRPCSAQAGALAARAARPTTAAVCRLA